VSQPFLFTETKKRFFVLNFDGERETLSLQSETITHQSQSLAEAADVILLKFKTKLALARPHKFL
jgi:hypothetical protein